jgi:two-component system phosphate regulon sensor histidine kinase PhoR
MAFALIGQGLLLAFLYLRGNLNFGSGGSWLPGLFGIALLTILLGLERRWRPEGLREAGERLGAVDLDGERTLSRLMAEMDARAIDLSIQQERLVALLQTMETGLVMVGADGEVLLKNDALDDIFSLSPEERRAASLPHLVRHYQFVDLWRTAMRLGAPQSLSAEVPQSKRFVRASAFPLGGALQGQALLRFQDVSELRRLETIRKDFVSNVSHELRTPLTSLKALTESLRGGALEEPETAKRFLEHIETEVDALSELVAELLELARIESPRAPLQREAANACQLLQRAAERLRVQADRAELTMEIECAAGLPLVWADPPRLEQVLVNLIHNAVKFTPPGGHIRLGAVGVSDGVQFSVADDGVGIARDVLPRIFERFYKTDRARNKSGTGLGLAISKHLVEAHGGRIWAESIEGQGSSFYFVVPAREPDPR